MTNGIERRQVLKAVAASTTGASLAGCIGTLDAGDDAGNGDPTDSGSEGDSVPHETACDLGSKVVAAFGDANFETAASYYPFEHVEAQPSDKAAVVEQFEATDWSSLEWVDTDVEDISCECAQAYPESDISEFDADVTGELTDALELRYAVTYDANGESATDAAFVDAVEIDDEWFATVSFSGNRELCGTDTGSEGASDGNETDGSGTDKEEADEQPLEPADWNDVDEIVLEANVSGWVGVEPAPIEGLENPTLLLFEGREYGFEWRNGDGLHHNLAIVDSNEEVLVKTDVVGEESASLAVQARSAMDSYVCEPHVASMFGDIEIKSE